MYISVSLGRCSWQIVCFDHKLDPTDMQLAHVLNLLCLNSILDFQTALTLSLRWKGRSNCLNAFVVLALSPSWKYQEKESYLPEFRLLWRSSILELFLKEYKFSRIELKFSRIKSSVDLSSFPSLKSDSLLKLSCSALK